MATRDIVISLGAGLSVQRGRDVLVSTGVGLGLGSVPWSGSRANRRSNRWLPRADIPWFDPRTGKPTPAFAAFMVELAENRMGGIDGATLPEVQVDTRATRAQAVAAAGIATDVNAYARGIAATVTTTAQVAQTAALPGSTAIPPVPDPPDPERWRDG